MTAAFFDYPKAAAFGRVVPKTRIYEHAGASTALKDLFVTQVDQIVWKFKLAPETINLPARPAVPEIQVFSIQMKTLELSFDVLRAIDQAVRFPIIFELSHAGRTQVIACHKRPTESDASRWMLSGYFASGWLADNAERSAMPVALDLGGLYEQLLRALLPWPARTRETLAEHVARLDTLAAKQREADKMAAKLEKERQFNRKVVINADLRRLQNELEALRR